MSGRQDLNLRPFGPQNFQPTSTKIPKPLRFMRCNATQEFRQLIPNSPFISLIAFIAEVYRGRTTANKMA